MEQITRIGMDTSKRFFQLHGADASERPVPARPAQGLPWMARLARLPIPDFLSMIMTGSMSGLPDVDISK